MTIKIISNIYGLETIRREGLEMEFRRYPKPPCGLLKIIKVFFGSFGYDYIILNFVSFDILILAFLKLICPFNRCKIVTVDLLLTRPETFREKLLKPFKIVLLKRVHLFLVLMKDTSGYEKCYYLRRKQFRYLPYKVNALELIQKTAVSDQGYIFCGGKSRRDFDTLFAVAAELPIPIKIVTVPNAELAAHGSYLDESLAPANVEIIRHDGSVGYFVQQLAGARLAVIPIKKDIITQAGIAVYIMAMALGKCVIISSGPGVDDVLPDGIAVIVPPEDPQALAGAIKKVYYDSDLRSSFARRGREYAMRLGGEENFFRSIVERIADDFSKARYSDASDSAV